jgi:hypothetical protein
MLYETRTLQSRAEQRSSTQYLVGPENLLAGPVVCVPYPYYRVVPSADEFLTSHLERHHSNPLHLICRIQIEMFIKHTSSRRRRMR